MKFSIGSFALELVKKLSDVKNPFDLLLDEIRAVVREEIAVALTKGSRELL